MPTRKIFKKLLSIICWNFLIFSLCGVAYGETSADVNWQSLETKYTFICYQSLIDLKKFDQKVDYSPGEWGIKRLFSRSDSNNMIDKLKKKVDALYERVQEILDMRKKMKKVTINIYYNKKQLHAVYQEIYKKPRKLRAWYIYEYNTIYISVDDLHEGMLAHEMAHSIIDHYLTVRPPGATAEILARYVDSHLFE
jgi:hypothetical protein